MTDHLSQLRAPLSGQHTVEREIQLAASLGQANIVPVLSAGDSDGLRFDVLYWLDGLRDDPRYIAPRKKVLATTFNQ